MVHPIVIALGAVATTVVGAYFQNRNYAFQKNLEYRRSVLDETRTAMRDISTLLNGRLNAMDRLRDGYAFDKADIDERWNAYREALGSWNELWHIRQANVRIYFDDGVLGMFSDEGGIVDRIEALHDLLVALRYPKKPLAKASIAELVGDYGSVKEADSARAELEEMLRDFNVALLETVEQRRRELLDR